MDNAEIIAGLRELAEEARISASDRGGAAALGYRYDADLLTAAIAALGQADALEVALRGEADKAEAALVTRTAAVGYEVAAQVDAHAIRRTWERVIALLEATDGH